MLGQPQRQLLVSMPTDVCKTWRRGGGWLAVGHTAVVGLLAVVMASTQGCGWSSDDDDGDGGGENPITDFGGRFLKTFRCVREEFKDFMEQIHSGQEVWEERRKLQHSLTRTWPSVQLTNEQGLVNICGDDKLGDISYKGLTIPDMDQIELYVPYTQDEKSFFESWQADLMLRVHTFDDKANKMKDQDLNGANVHDKYHEIAVETNKEALAVENSIWTQGHASNAWQSDAFAGQLVGHTLLASLLEKNGNEWIFDMVGPHSATEPVQVMKQQILAMFPDSLLKSRATFTDDPASGPSLSKIEVQFNQKREGSSSSGVQWEIVTDEALMEFTSSSGGIRWELAKKVFFSGALYVLECYHTGIHLYQGSVIAAVRNSIPAGTLLGETVKPQTQQVLFALLEQAAALHADHGPGLNGDGTIFNGGVWPTPNLNLVWENCRDIARYYVDYSPAQFLGGTDKPDWWAGMSSTFIEPIEKFANAMAMQVFEEGNSESFLIMLQAKLEESRLVVKPSSPVDVTTVGGLAKFLTNMMFVPSILHTHMYSTRETFTPLFFQSTKEFEVYLSATEDPDSMQQVLQGAFPTIKADFHQIFFIAYGTACGFAPHLGQMPPELGDGPYYGPFAIPNSNVSSALSTFQIELAQKRLNVMTKFGTFEEGNGKWVPAYFYPKGELMPFGYGITQTVYI